MTAKWWQDEPQPGSPRWCDAWQCTGWMQEVVTCDHAEECIACDTPMTVVWVEHFISQDDHCGIERWCTCPRCGDRLRQRLVFPGMSIAKRREIIWEAIDGAVSDADCPE
jgi:hypothetical protein